MIATLDFPILEAMFSHMSDGYISRVIRNISHFMFIPLDSIYSRRYDGGYLPVD